jgi:hypothetical protein
MNPRAAVVIAAVLFPATLAGCGDAKKTSSPPTPAAATSTPATTAGGDETQLKTLAETYLHAVAARDWAAACSTRTQGEQKSFAAQGGTCEKTFAAVLGKQSVSLFKDARASAVRIKGAVAGIDIVQGSQTTVATTLAAVRDGGEWKLKDLPDAQTP